MSHDYSRVRGFNYQPGYASCAYEAWMWFDAAAFRRELGWGKRHFPGMNAVRLWLSWDAYVRAPRDFAARFEEALEICADYGAQVVATLFNRWHNAFCDNGGVFMERLTPGGKQYDRWFFKDFVEDICAAHKSDPRVLIWDLCNEPFSFNNSFDDARDLVNDTLRWLEDMSNTLAEIGVEQDAGVSIHGATNREMLEIIEPISGVLLIHPYFQRTPDMRVYAKRCEQVLAHLDWQCEFARAKGKGILVTECCWGSIDDDVFRENIERTLTEFNKRNLGFIAHALCHSEVADLHAPKYGPILADMGQFNFIDQNGNLRPGLDIFNKF